MSKITTPYIRLSGRWTAAVENERATVQFVREHLEKENVPEKESARVLRDLKAWFRNNPVGIKSHTINLPDGKRDTEIIVFRVLRGDQ